MCSAVQQPVWSSEREIFIQNMASVWQNGGQSTWFVRSLRSWQDVLTLLCHHIDGHILEILYSLTAFTSLLNFGSLYYITKICEAIKLDSLPP